MTLPDGPLLVDASFLIGLADQEVAAMRLVSVLKRCRITSVNFGEVAYKLHQRTGVSADETTHTFVTSLGVAVDPVVLDDVLHFPHLKDLDRASREAQRQAGVQEPKSLSLADMVCLAVAQARRLPVLTGDRHWTALAPHGLRCHVFDYRDPATTA